MAIQILLPDGTNIVEVLRDIAGVLPASITIETTAKGMAMPKVSLYGTNLEECERKARETYLRLRSDLNAEVKTHVSEN